MYVCVCLYICVYVCVCVYVCMYVYVCIYVCMCVCVCMYLSISGSCQRYIFQWEGHIFCHEVFFRVYLPLDLEVYYRTFIDN